MRWQSLCGIMISRQLVNLSTRQLVIIYINKVLMVVYEKKQSIASFEGRQCFAHR